MGPNPKGGSPSLLPVGRQRVSSSGSRELLCQFEKEDPRKGWEPLRERVEWGSSSVGKESML